MRLVPSATARQIAEKHNKLINGEAGKMSYLSQIHFVETFFFKSKQIEMELIASNEYNAYVYVGIPLHELIRLNCLVKTGARPNVVITSCYHYAESSRTSS